MNNVTWGISCAAITADDVPLPSELHEIFQLLELSGAALQPLTERRLDSFCRHVKRLFIRNPLAPGLTREAAGQSETIIGEFKQHFRRLLLQAGDADVEGVTVDFELERAIADVAYRDCLRKLLHNFWGTLYESGVNLLFPLRLPMFSEHVSVSDYLEFRHRLMFANVFFCVDLHPHELVGKDISIDDFIRRLRFDLAMVRVVYEPATGNRLVPKLITPWLERLAKFSVPANIIFAPIISSRDALEHELGFLEQFIGDLGSRVES